LCAAPDAIASTTLHDEDWCYNRYGRLFVPSAIKIVREGAFVILRGPNGANLRIRQSEFETLENGRTGLTWVTSDGMSYLAFFDVVVPSEFDVLCIRNASKQVLWRTRCESTGQTSIMLGIGLHWVELKLHNDCIFVFGACRGQYYIEKFSVASGENCMRFSTTLYGALTDAE
jgi:hypothetical protein